MKKAKTENDPAAQTEKKMPRQQRGAVTSDGILRAALRLMAENGYNGVSLRKIGIEAGVNLALMNYHFGTKAQLLLAIFQRYGTVFNNKRMELLEKLEQRHPDSTIPLEDLLHAFVSATLHGSRAEQEDDLHFQLLSGRLSTDPTPEVRAVVAEVYDSAALKFVRLLRQACSHLSTREFVMRVVFLYGAMLYTRADTGRIDSLADKLEMSMPRMSAEETTNYMVPFLAAGFRAAPFDTTSQ